MKSFLEILLSPKNKLSYQDSQFSVANSLDLTQLELSPAVDRYARFAGVKQKEVLDNEINKNRFFVFKSKAWEALDEKEVWESAWHMVYQSLIDASELQFSSKDELEDSLKARLLAALAFIYSQWENYLDGLNKNNHDWDKEYYHNFKPDYLKYCPKSYIFYVNNKAHQVISSYKEEFENKLTQELQGPNAWVALKYIADKNKKTTYPIQLLEKVELVRPLEPLQESGKIYTHLLHEAYYAAPKFLGNIQKFFGGLLFSSPASHLIDFFNNRYSCLEKSQENNIKDDVEMFQYLIKDKKLTPEVLQKSDYLKAYLSYLSQDEKDQYFLWFKIGRKNVKSENFRNIIATLANLLMENKLNLYTFKKTLLDFYIVDQKEKFELSEIENYLNYTNASLSKLAHLLLLYEKNPKLFTKDYMQKNMDLELDLKNWHALYFNSDCQKSTIEFFNCYIESKLHPDYIERLKHRLNIQDESELKQKIKSHFLEILAHKKQDTLNVTEEIEILACMHPVIDIQDIDTVTGTFLNEEKLQEALNFFKINPHEKKYPIVINDKKFGVELINDADDQAESLVIKYSHKHKSIDEAKMYKMKNGVKISSGIFSSGGYGVIRIAHILPIKNNRVDENRFSHRLEVRKIPIYDTHSMDFLEESNNAEIATNQPVIFTWHKSKENIKYESHFKLILGMDLKNWTHNDSQDPNNNIARQHLPNVVLHCLNRIKFLQQKGLTHRDIKPDNIMLHVDKNGDGRHIKLTDYGSAVHKKIISIGRAGTPDYMAPWIDSIHSKYNLDTDLWSLGMTIKVLFGNVIQISKDPNDEFSKSLLPNYELPTTNVSQREYELLKLSNMMMGYTDVWGENGNHPKNHQMLHLDQFIQAAEEIVKMSPDIELNPPVSGFSRLISCFSPS